jgi:hypothetical protein
MKSQALQELIKKIFNDERTRQQFESNPDSVLSHFSLTEQEKKAVLNTHAKLGLVNGNSQQLEAALDPTGQWNAPTL